MTNGVVSGIKDLGHRIFGGYAELLSIPHTARFTVGAVIACMPYPMVGMTITIAVQFYYGNYSLAGGLTAVQAIAGAALGPVLGTLVDRFGQRQVSIPTIVVWMVAATAMITCIKAHVAPWILFCIVPFLAATPPWGAMSRQRWTNLLRHNRGDVNRAMSLCGVFDEAMWVVGNPLASILAVISGVLAFSFTGMCVIIGALMFLTELTTEPMSQTRLAKMDGVSRAEFRRLEDEKAKKLRAETARLDARRRMTAEGASPEATKAAEQEAYDRAMAGKKESIWGPGLVAVCVTWFGLGAFQSAASISIVSFATEAGMKSYTGFVFACFSISSLTGALLYGAKNWTIPLWKRFYFCLAVVNLGIGTFLFARHLWVIMIIYLVIGVCQAPTWVNGNQLMLHLVPQTRFTEGMAWMGAMNSIGGSAGSAIAGVFIDRYGSHGGFSVVTILALVSLAIAFCGLKQIKTSTETPVLTELG
ncbi:MFS transporter [Bifidobacterium choloepi]|uniref:MFS transporter n=1 Tax=Bifidobacterium choloepi TaxID=2614131 RepID=A0A6I5NM55_9BIFI|nr:MFS transporter [Bifidobacterium choloepi]NEG69812.1 MFS transporter [Bifidobacterium choloepi]